MIYTQEPWEIQKGNIGPYIISKNVLGGVVPIAQVFQRGIANCETDGNAKLLKGSVKMYQALDKIARCKGAFCLDKPEGITQAEEKINIMTALANEALAEVEGKEEEDGS